MAAPVQFIAVDPTTKQLVVTPEARRTLSQLHGTVAVCSVAGVYRTGKSYILNQLAGKNSGFGIGSSVQACTKGIWLWGAPLQTGSSAMPDAAKHLLLLDTEGLQSICQSEGHDAKIFCLAILLSSFFVYNSDKAVNNAAIDQLSLVAQLTKKIRVHTESGESDASSLAQFFPQFIWLLRDFQLELTDAEGRPISQDQYLEECLQPQRGSSSAVAEQNQTREAIRKLFPQRSCITLPHPTLGTALPPSAVKQLPELSKLAPGFRDGVTELKRRVVSSARPKQLNGTPVTGVMLLELAEAYTNAINNGAVPTISTAWQAVLHIECGKALEAALKLYRDGARAAASAEPPLDDSAWQAKHEALLRDAVALFHQMAVGEGAREYEARLLEAVRGEAEQQQKLLHARSEVLCQKLLSTLSDRMSAYMRVAASPHAHADNLPKLIEEGLHYFYAHASGPAREETHRHLMAKVVECVRAVLSDSATQVDAEKQQAAQQLEQLHRRLAHEEAARAEAVAALQSAQAKAEAIDRAKAAAEATLGRLSEASRAGEQERARLHAQLEAVEAQRALEAARAERLERESGAQALHAAEAARAAERRAAEAEGARDALARDNAALRAQLESEKAKLGSEAAALQRTIEQLRLDLSAATSEKESLAARVAEARASSDAGSKRARTQEPAEGVENDDAYAASMMGDMAQAPAQGGGLRRPSVDPKEFAIPKLMAMLRSHLGQAAKLPKKKDELLSLCYQHNLC
mmetsp:Transcript_12137/g.30127  ORF Transcript_12137/g.30127 Transcript_12137/m.30127 type:complete len:748 (+) Transcript_12137:34-2277(+)